MYGSFITMPTPNSPSKSSRHCIHWDECLFIVTFILCAAALTCCVLGVSQMADADDQASEAKIPTLAGDPTFLILIMQFLRQLHDVFIECMKLLRRDDTTFVKNWLFLFILVCSAAVGMAAPIAYARIQESIAIRGATANGISSGAVFVGIAASTIGAINLNYDVQETAQDMEMHNTAATIAGLRKEIAELREENQQVKPKRKKWYKLWLF